MSRVGIFEPDPVIEESVVRLHTPLRNSFNEYTRKDATVLK